MTNPFTMHINRSLADSLRQASDHLPDATKMVPVHIDESLPRGVFRLTRTATTRADTPDGIHLSTTITAHEPVYPGGNAGRRARRQDRRLSIAAAPNLARSIVATLHDKTICLAYRAKHPLGLPPDLLTATPAQANATTLRQSMPSDRSHSSDPSDSPSE